MARGGLGVAVFLAEASRFFDEPKLLAAAMRWHRAAGEIARQRGAFGPLFLDRQHATRTGIYTGRGGYPWVSALLADRSGKPSERARALAGLERAWRASRDRGYPGFLSGAAGYAEAAAEALADFADLSSEERDVLERIGEGAQKALLEELARPLREDDDLALAFGRAGVVWAALRWSPRHPLVKANLERLATARRPHSGLVLWPHSERAPFPHPMMQTWCNGTTGMLRLFARAHGTLQEPWLLEVMRDALVSMAGWRSTLPTLCCGAAGQGLAILDVARQYATPLMPTARRYLRSAIAKDRTLGTNLLVGRAGIAMTALMFQSDHVRRPLGVSNK
jgi:hypothetical protein